MKKKDLTQKTSLHRHKVLGKLGLGVILSHIKMLKYVNLLSFISWKYGRLLDLSIFFNYTFLLFYWILKIA